MFSTPPGTVGLHVMVAKLIKVMSRYLTMFSGCMRVYGLVCLGFSTDSTVIKWQPPSCHIASSYNWCGIPTSCMWDLFWQTASHGPWSLTVSRCPPALEQHVATPSNFFHSCCTCSIAADADIHHTYLMIQAFENMAFQGIRYHLRYQTPARRGRLVGQRPCRSSDD